MSAVGVRSLDMSAAVMVRMSMRMSIQARVPTGMLVRMKMRIGGEDAGEVARCLCIYFSYSLRRC